MLTALEDAKENGAEIVAVNPLPESSLKRYKNPQKVRASSAAGPRSPTSSCRSGSAATWRCCRRCRSASCRPSSPPPAPSSTTPSSPSTPAGTRRSSSTSCRWTTTRSCARPGSPSRRSTSSPSATCAPSGRSSRGRWASRSTPRPSTRSRRSSTSCSSAGTSAVRRRRLADPRAQQRAGRPHDGHLGADARLVPRRTGEGVPLRAAARARGRRAQGHHGDAARRDQVLDGMGGNLVAAISDSKLAEAAFRGTEMTVQVSTKLNRSHAVVGDEALILPTMGRTEIDVQAAGPQFVSVEDTVCSVHGSHGQVPPVARACCPRSRSSASWRRPRSATAWPSTGRACVTTTTSSATTSATSSPASRTTPAAPRARRASSCRTVPATRGPSPRRPARR